MKNNPNAQFVLTSSFLSAYPPTESECYINNILINILSKVTSNYIRTKQGSKALSTMNSIDKIFCNELENYLSEYVQYINENIDLSFYIWIDGIEPVSFDMNGEYWFDNIEESDSDDEENMYVYRLCDIVESLIKTYERSNIYFDDKSKIYIVNIDLMPKDRPMTIIFPDDYDEEDENYNDDEY